MISLNIWGQLILLILSIADIKFEAHIFNMESKQASSLKANV